MIIFSLTSQAKTAVLRIFFITSQIDKSQHFGALVTNISPIEVGAMRGSIDYLAIWIKVKDFIFRPRSYDRTPFRACGGITFDERDRDHCRGNCELARLFQVENISLLLIKSKIFQTMPKSVDFPASTLPTTATRTSQKSASASRRLRNKKSRVSRPSFISRERSRVREQFSLSATFSSDFTALSQSSGLRPSRGE